MKTMTPFALERTPTYEPSFTPAPGASALARPLDFDLPSDLEATAPPEARGLRRDAVRLMVSRLADDAVAHTRFDALGDHLEPGDVLVVNTSATLPAALPATREEGLEPRRVSVHLSTRMCDRVWTIEVRHPVDAGDAPIYDARAGERLRLPGGGRLRLLAPLERGGAARDSLEEACGCDEEGDVSLAVQGAEGGLASRDRAIESSSGLSLHIDRPSRADRTAHLDFPSRSDDSPRADRAAGRPHTRVRLWLASLELPMPLEPYLHQHGAPIRYGYVRKTWDLAHYQTVFAAEPGSAEMPSAGRAFTPELVARLAVRGVIFAPLVLHTGVASLEDHEPPYAERFTVPASTADVVNAARAAGHRVIAVGTTAVRALETLASEAGRVAPGQGWTELVIGPGRPMRVVDGLLTGFHEPRASHLHMLEALAGRRHLRTTYGAALEERYLWHEFGDLHLIVP